MSVAKMSGQSLMTEVGILSIGDDLAGMDLMSLRTLTAEGGVMAERGSDMWRDCTTLAFQCMDVLAHVGPAVDTAFGRI